MAEERVRRRLAAILAADVVGYSRLVRADEEGTLAALKALHAATIDPKITENDGRVVKLMGDGLLAEFSSAVDAVRSAVEIQRALAERNSDRLEKEQIEYRIGINLGDVVIDGDDIQGDGINVASRLEGLSEPGGMCISAAVYDQVRDRIDLAFEDLGDQEVKNIDRPIRVWRWCGAATAADIPQTSGATPLPLPDKPSIAVLPFNNMSGDPEQEYFSDGISEDIITALSCIRQFFVIARNTSFTFKGRPVDVQAVASNLGVRYVLEGSVRKAGNRVRITAQLIDGETGRHLWADRYDRNLEDIFEVQDEITRTVVGAIEPEMDRAERERALQKQPENLVAWDHLQRGYWHLFKFERSSVTQAKDHFARAIELDPNFARAHAALAHANFVSIRQRYSDSPAEDLEAGYVS